jgi:hypothetical protein
MKKGYHPYLRNVPATPSKKALQLDQEEYDSSDDEAVDRVYLGVKKDVLLEMYLEEKRQKEALQQFVKQMLDSQRKNLS